MALLVSLTAACLTMALRSAACLTMALRSAAWLVKWLVARLAQDHFGFPPDQPEFLLMMVAKKELPRVVEREPPRVLKVESI